MTSLRRLIAPLVPLTLLAGALFTARPAFADDAVAPPVVVFAPTGKEPKCLRAGELLSAVRRDTGLAAREDAAAASAPRAPGAIVVRVSAATNGAPVVRITRGASDVEQTLPAPSCEATTDAVAAFVASTVAPVAPPIATNPVPPPARAPASPDADAQEASAPPAETSRRAEVLALALERHKNGRHWIQWTLGGLVATEGVLVGVLAAMTEDRQPPSSRMLMVASSSFLVGGGIGSYFAPDDAYMNVIAVSSYAGLGLFVLSTEGFRNSTNDAFTPGVFAILGSGYLGTSLMYAIDGRVHPPVGEKRLARAYAQIATPAQRASITSDELAVVEQEFLDADRHLSPWLLNAPMIAAGVAATTVSLVRLNELDTGARATTAILSGTALGSAVLAAFAEPSPATRAYEKALKQQGLEIHVSPTVGGLSISGRF